MVQSSVKKTEKTPKNDSQDSITPNTSQIPLNTQDDSDKPVYNRLYTQSIGAADSQSFRNRTTKPTSIIIPSLCVDESENIVQNKIYEYINEIVGNKPAITSDELISIFSQLGILEPKEKIEDISVFEPKLEKWKIENNYYDTLLIKKDLITALTAKKGKFNYFARQRMNIFFANTKRKIESPRKNQEDTSEENQFSIVSNDDDDHKEKPKSHLSRRTLARLLENPKKDNNEEEEKIEVFEKVPLSEETQKILLQSSIGNLPFEERGEKLIKNAEKETIKLAKKIEKQRIGDRQKPVQIELTPEMREKVDEIRRKKKEPLPEPSYRPQIQTYEEFLKLKEKLFDANIPKPPKYDEDIQRHREGYKLYLHEKAVKESIQAIPPLPPKKKKKKVKKETPKLQIQETNLQPEEPLNLSESNIRKNSKQNDHNKRQLTQTKQAVFPYNSPRK